MKLNSLFPVFQKKKAFFSKLMLSSLPFGLLLGLQAHGSGQKAGTLSTDHSDLMKLAVKFVEFKDTNGDPVLNQKAMNQVTQRINQLYAPCQIEFVAEKFHPVEPERLGLGYNTQSMTELDPIRSQFQDPKRLVVINTGDWNHSSMGAANAWTAMPGENLAGAVIEADAASFGGIVAHELGHYLSLDHMENTENMMNPIIYGSSTTIDTDQCNQMRDAARKYWTASLR